MSFASNDAAQPLPSAGTERESHAVPTLTIEAQSEGVEEQAVESQQGEQQAQDKPDATKRPREDDATSDSASKRPRVANDEDTGNSMMDKLKTETQQLIENPEKALMPDPIPPGEEGISTYHDNDVLSGMYY